MNKELQRETQEKIARLQMIEENLQQYALSKQTINSQIIEIDSALKEIEGKKTAFKISGTIMIEKSANEIKEELFEKKKTSDLRLKNIEKQEEKIKEKFSELQNEIMSELKKSDKNEI